MYYKILPWCIICYNLMFACPSNHWKSFYQNVYSREYVNTFLKRKSFIQLNSTYRHLTLWEWTHKHEACELIQKIRINRINPFPTTSGMCSSYVINVRHWLPQPSESTLNSQDFKIESNFFGSTVSLLLNNKWMNDWLKLF